MPKRVANAETIRRFNCLQKTVTSALLALEGKEDSQYHKNTVAHLKEMNDTITKYGELIYGDRNPTVGVFGCPSRGKSTLLNVLLGFNILPMEGLPGTTRLGTYILNNDDKKTSEDPYKITVTYKQRKTFKSYYRALEDDVRSLLENLSKEANAEDSDIQKIEVEGPFRSYLGDDIVFVDTPGVEPGANEEKLKRAGMKNDYVADKDRALEILSNVDIVIFCMRYDDPLTKDKVFYNDHIKELDPINVITCSDQRDKGVTIDELKEQVRKDYDLVINDTVAVSSTEALQKLKLNAPKNKEKDINKIVEAEFTSDNLEGFKELKRKILKKTGNEDIDSIKKKIDKFEKEYLKLREVAEENKIDLPKLNRSWERGKTVKNIAIILGLVFLAALVAPQILQLSRGTVLQNVTIAPQENLPNNIQYTRNNNTIVIPRGAELWLTAVKEPRNAKLENVDWTVDNGSVVSLTKNDTQATIRALAIGTAKVYVYADGAYMNYITITVTRNPSDYVPVESVRFDPPPRPLIVGAATYTLNKIILPGYASTQTVTWRSGNPSVAAVDRYGVVTPLSAGTTEITVTTDGYNANGYRLTYTARITVEEILLTLRNLGIPTAGTTQAMPERNPETNRFTISNTNPNARLLVAQEGRIAGATIVYLDRQFGANASISARVRIIERRTNSNENGVFMGMISTTGDDVRFVGMKASVTGQKRVYSSGTGVTPINISQKLIAQGGSGWLDDANDIVSINGAAIPYDEEFILEVIQTGNQGFTVNLRNNNTGVIIASGNNYINLQNTVPGFIIANATVEISQILVKSGNNAVFSTIESAPILIPPETIGFTYPSSIAGTYPDFTFEHSIAEGNNSRTFGASVLPPRALQNIVWAIDGANATLSSTSGPSVTARFPQTGTVKVTASVADVPDISATLTINVINTVIPVSGVSVRAADGAVAITAGGNPVQFFADPVPANATTPPGYTLRINNSDDYDTSSNAITGARISSAGYLTVDQSYDSSSIWVFAASNADPSVRSSLEFTVVSNDAP